MLLLMWIESFAYEHRRAFYIVKFNSQLHTDCIRIFSLQQVMSASLEVLLEAARYIEQQEQRERLTSTSSSASSLSTSPHSTGRFYPSNYVSQHSLAATPPASPLSSDIPRTHIDFISTNGTTILRNGKFVVFSPFFFIVSLCFFWSIFIFISPFTFIFQ